MSDRSSGIKGGKGPSSALFLADNIPKPVPERDEALVEVKYFGLNRMDLSQRAGNYPVPLQASKILGVEFAGIIKDLGEDTHGDGFEVGDEIFGLAYGGRFSSCTSMQWLIN
jgi:NADPH:quinone reductase-like Zn-dependent oxidoreductase